jgi:uracil-DNA glycosylase family 4
MAFDLMAQSFSDSSDCAAKLAALQTHLAGCTRCVAAGHLAAANPVAGSRGPADAWLMLIGQAPGRLSVARGIPFGGPGGIVLGRWLDRAGFPPGYLRTGVYLSALTRCFPGKAASGKGDRAPSPAELALCRPWLDAELAIIDPRVVLLVGGMAIRAFLGAAPLEHMVGQVIAHAGRLWLPLPHPSGVSRWLNTPAHQALVDRALAELSALRERFEA